MTALPDIPERDAALAQVVLEHSDEMPPAHLDAAILAAWWMPLAAAATIGAVAIGILQVVPPEEPVTAPSTVTDMPAAGKTERDALTPMERKDAPRMQTESGVAQAPATVVAQPAPPPAISRANAPTPRVAQKSLAASAADTLAAPSTAKDVAPQPFPADKKRESGNLGFAQDRAGAAGSVASAPSAAPPSEPQRALAKVPAAPSPPMAAPPALARNDAQQREEIAQSPSAMSGAAPLARKAVSTEAASAPIDADAWIARIRKLHDDGKLADAAKELVALRARGRRPSRHRDRRRAAGRAAAATDAAAAGRLLRLGLRAVHLCDLRRSAARVGARSRTDPR